MPTHEEGWKERETERGRRRGEGGDVAYIRVPHTPPSKPVNAAPTGRREEADHAGRPILPFSRSFASWRPRSVESQLLKEEASLTGKEMTRWRPEHLKEELEEP